MSESAAGWAQLNTGRFAFIAQFVSDEANRYDFTGVHIERHPVKGVMIVATNNKSMAVAYDPDGHISTDTLFIERDFGQVAELNAACVEDPENHRTVIFQPSADGLAQATVYHQVGRGIEAVRVGIVRCLGNMPWPPWHKLMPLAAFENRHPNTRMLNAGELFPFFLPYQPATIARLSLFQESAEPDDAMPVAIVRGDLDWFLGCLMPLKPGYQINTCGEIMAVLKEAHDVAD